MWLQVCMASHAMSSHVGKSPMHGKTPRLLINDSYGLYKAREKPRCILPGSVPLLFAYMPRLALHAAKGKPHSKGGIAEAH